MGLTQHKNGVETIREYVNLLLLKGAIGKENAGTCPVRGHSNVQGDRSVGIMHFVDEDLNERIKEHMGFDPPTKQGIDVVESMEAMHTGKASLFIVKQTSKLYCMQSKSNKLFIISIKIGQ